MSQGKSTERVTVKCVYCGRTIDGYFFGDRKRIVHLASGDVLATAGQYENRKGFLHTACQRGLDAIAEQEKGDNRG